MGEVLLDKIVKTRKEHSCFSCGNKIKVNEQARSIKYVNDGIFTVYECSNCVLFTKKVCKFCKCRSCYDEHEGAYDENYIYQCINEYD